MIVNTREKSYSSSMFEYTPLGLNGMLCTIFARCWYHLIVTSTITLLNFCCSDLRILRVFRDRVLLFGLRL